MSGSVINLKNKLPQQEAEQDLLSDDAAESGAEDEEFALTWTAPEYERMPRGRYWFLVPGGIALAFALLGILTKSYLLIALVVLAFLVVLMYDHRQPRWIRFTVSSTGIQVGTRWHRAADLESFWIRRLPAGNELFVKTDKRLMPYLQIPLGDADPDEIQEALKTFLPEVEHEESSIDQVARILGF